MIGVPYSVLVLAFQREAGAVLKNTGGDMGKVINHVLSELHKRDIIGADDFKRLQTSFAEGLDVFAGKQKSSDVIVSVHRRYMEMVADATSNDVARALAELCHSVVGHAAKAESNGPKPGIAMATIDGGAEVLLWGVIGAVVGGALTGGVGGALVGGLVGAAVGSCGSPDSNTNVTITNNGGQPPA